MCPVVKPGTEGRAETYSPSQNWNESHASSHTFLSIFSQFSTPELWNQSLLLAFGVAPRFCILPKSWWCSITFPPTTPPHQHFSMNVCLIWGISNRIQYEEYCGVIISPFFFLIRPLYVCNKSCKNCFLSFLTNVMLVIYIKSAISQNHCFHFSCMYSSLPTWCI